ncbi:Glyoxalase domain-containing protein 4 [Saguinus oedipus]|uniref:Glyoxalase domain-containing protein 4 n=1 Tax=Saguinus oedipus TaxID=9490 RepID=A0ABQ9VM14_SAGOE|nr:Glyoxalase domain-containing protein 4 [Saguinus oedipus]
MSSQVLRHEEFEEGCKAACNGPYDGKWSKTMVGFGPEDDHFVAELTYNYGIGDYKLGNDFMGLTLASSQAVSNARKLGWPLTEIAEGVFETEAPGGYKFYLQNCSLPQSDKQMRRDPVLKVTLAVSDLQKSLNYWCNLLGMKIYEKDEEKQRALLGYADNQCKLELQGVKDAVDHAAAFGRIAFSCPQKELPGLEDLMKREKQKILTPLVSLDTPGKATVQVVILADPDGHEICFVGDEAFRELSKMDPEGSRLLDDLRQAVVVDEAMAADKSDEWFAKHNKPKASALSERFAPKYSTMPDSGHCAGWKRHSVLFDVTCHSPPLRFSSQSFQETSSLSIDIQGKSNFLRLCEQILKTHSEVWFPLSSEVLVVVASLVYWCQQELELTYVVTYENSFYEGRSTRKSPATVDLLLWVPFSTPYSSH